MVASAVSLVIASFSLSLANYLYSVHIFAETIDMAFLATFHRCLVLGMMIIANKEVREVLEKLPLEVIYF